MSLDISARSRVFAVVGDPVGHSLSPVIHNAAIRAAGLDGIYVALRVRGDDLPGVVRGLARAGGGGNVTLPHKEKAASLVEEATAAVRRTGACNTFWMEDGRIRGDNTDVEGFSRALKVFLGATPRLGQVLLLGAGGAARACLVALLDLGAEEIHLLNRTPERARVVARRIGGSKTRVLEDPRALSGEAYDLVVNATSLGLGADDPSPVDFDLFGRVGAAMDLIYGPRPTRFQLEARERGIRLADGSEMLIQQAAVSFEGWWGVQPPLSPMREALEKAVRR